MAQPFPDLLLVSNPFFDIPPPLTFTAEFSLPSLTSLIVVSPQTTFIQAVLTIQVQQLFLPICYCILPKGIWQSLLAQAQHCSRPFFITSG